GDTRPAPTPQQRPPSFRPTSLTITSWASPGHGREPRQWRDTAMRWHVDEHGRLVISVTKREQRSLQAPQRRDGRGQGETRFDSDALLHEWLEPLVTNDVYTWLPEGCTGDLSSAPCSASWATSCPARTTPTKRWAWAWSTSVAGRTGGGPGSCT